MARMSDQIRGTVFRDVGNSPFYHWHSLIHRVAFVLAAEALHSGGAL